MPDAVIWYKRSVSCKSPGHAAADRDISPADLPALLRDFYGRAFTDDLLGPVFVDVARMDLDAHLPTIRDFWQTVLFRTGDYRRNAFVPHQRLHAAAGLTPEHFARWLQLWIGTVDDRHAGPKAEFAKLQASRIAGSMSRRITGHALNAMSEPRPTLVQLKASPDS